MSENPLRRSGRARSPSSKGASPRCAPQPAGATTRRWTPSARAEPVFIESQRQRHGRRACGISA